MKTVEEIRKEIFDIIDAQGKPPYEGPSVSDILEQFEINIRKDQDKITRHACADEIDKLPSIDAGFSTIAKVDHCKAVSTCINVDVFKTSSEDSKKTMPCPCCDTPLILPKEYFGALKKLREKILAYRDVLIKDIKLDAKDWKSTDDDTFEEISEVLKEKGHLPPRPE